MMQRGKCRSLLSPRFFLSLILSITASLLFITVIANQHQNPFLFIGGTRDIADRTVLFVRTAQNCQSRLKYLLESWIPKDLSKQSNIYLITDNIPNDTNVTIFNLFRNVVETNCPSTHGEFDLCCKTAHEFDAYYSLTKINSNLEWMCRFDDDQYVNVDNLYKYLSQMNSSKPYYIGRISYGHRLSVPEHNRTYMFATYGAGVCYSHTLLKQLRSHVHVNVLPKNCAKLKRPDDVYMGYLIELIVNVSLTPVNDLLHSHLDVLDGSFRRYSLNDLARMITFGFSSQVDHYELRKRLDTTVTGKNTTVYDRISPFFAVLPEAVLRSYVSVPYTDNTETYDRNTASGNTAKYGRAWSYFSVYDRLRSRLFDLEWDRYTLDWLRIIHQLIELTKQDQYEAANRLWLFLRNYEKEHPQNLTNKYDQSCTSYERLRNKTLLLNNETTTQNSNKST
ncbi:unnamed protein product [Adineta steineri]|uniref:Fringe-like glycosyltransferase domain-containing protein n=1 Tax=Adineta steineri TaxID=433720 RepID=A0A813N614_9BILA|nr:unnamed protein product [Adineta steineri]CAF0738869.1 unnamed protein product [Adineta steineri]CAF0748704.1 unnamed protein product [Adineta steineri]